MNFPDFPIHQDLLDDIARLGFQSPTPVQEQVIPKAIERHDMRVCAQTGTGKTLAFAIPVVNRLINEPELKKPSCLVLVPTRELGAQVHHVFRDITHKSPIDPVLILGGMNMNRQVDQLKAGSEVVVATPGRLLDHVRRHTINLKNIDTLVFDEADRMLDMGFLPDIRQILRYIPKNRQTMLFSATYPIEIQQMVAQFCKDPISIDLAPSTPANTVTQMVYPVSRSQKELLLQALLEGGNITSAIIFCRTKSGADRLVVTLKKIGRSVTVIHSDRSQKERNEALTGFKQKRFQLLVATDIAARGIDIKDISHVINYDVPHHPEDYVHRIGRTGRAQATGDAFTLVSPDEEQFIRRIERFINKTIPRGAIPDFPYLVPPKLVSKPKPIIEGFNRYRKRIASSRAARFRKH